METKKVYIYTFTTIPEAVEYHGGNISIIEKNGKIEFDNYVSVEDYDFINISNFDNLDMIVDESFQDGLCYNFFSFRNDRLLDFKITISEILQNKINNCKKKIETLETLQKNLMAKKG